MPQLLTPPNLKDRENKMVSTPSFLKTLHPLQVFSTKSPSSTLTSMKIKTLIHTLIISHVCRIIRALSKAKSILVEILKENQPLHFIFPTKNSKRKNRSRKIFLGSFRLHYNWCSSHVLPVSEPVLNGFSTSHFYYDSTWNSIITNEQYEDNTESQLSGYLHWLEEKVDDEDSSGTEKDINRLADLFIASCHEKFILEKQESYRRFQEMMARSMWMWGFFLFNFSFAFPFFYVRTLVWWGKYILVIMGCKGFIFLGSLSFDLVLLFFSFFFFLFWNGGSIESFTWYREGERGDLCNSWPLEIW